MAFSFVGAQHGFGTWSGNIKWTWKTEKYIAHVSSRETSDQDMSLQFTSVDADFPQLTTLKQSLSPECCSDFNPAGSVIQ